MEAEKPGLDNRSTSKKKKTHTQQQPHFQRRRIANIANSDAKTKTMPMPLHHRVLHIAMHHDLIDLACLLLPFRFTYAGVGQCYCVVDATATAIAKVTAIATATTASPIRTPDSAPDPELSGTTLRPLTLTGVAVAVGGAML